MNTQIIATSTLRHSGLDEQVYITAWTAPIAVLI
jgi:hypothetical protein